MEGDIGFCPSSQTRNFNYIYIYIYEYIIQTTVDIFFRRHTLIVYRITGGHLSAVVKLCKIIYMEVIYMGMDLLQLYSLPSKFLVHACILDA